MKKWINGQLNQVIPGQHSPVTCTCVRGHTTTHVSAFRSGSHLFADQLRTVTHTHAQHCTPNSTNRIRSACRVSRANPINRIPVPHMRTQTTVHKLCLYMTMSAHPLTGIKFTQTPNSKSRAHPASRRGDCRSMPPCCEGPALRLRLRLLLPMLLYKTHKSWGHHHRRRRLQGATARQRRPNRMRAQHRTHTQHLSHE